MDIPGIALGTSYGLIASENQNLEFFLTAIALVFVDGHFIPPTRKSHRNPTGFHLLTPNRVVLQISKDLHVSDSEPLFMITLRNSDSNARTIIQFRIHGDRSCMNFCAFCHLISPGRDIP